MHLLSQNIGEKGGPNTAKMKQLDPWADGGYICGNEVPIKRFVMMQKVLCGSYIELQYYNPLDSAANWGRGDSSQKISVKYAFPTMTLSRGMKL